jgi:peptide/nickel transport system permease protein
MIFKMKKTVDAIDESIKEASFKVKTPWQQIRADFLEDKAATVSLFFFIAAILMAVFAPLIVPQNPYDLTQLNIMDGLSPPMTQSSEAGYTYFLGTDEQGRDMLSGIVYGIRISIGVACISTILATILGSVLGIVAAYAGGKLDSFLMRLVDLQLSFPGILVALILLAVFGKGVDKILIALIVVQWAGFARIIRSAALVEKQKEYIESAHCLALSKTRIIFGHLMPNSLPQVIVMATIYLASAMKMEATLSFLGVGMPITKPSLGLLVSNGQDYILNGQYWMSFFPGFALFLLVFSANLISDRMRDIFNPRLKK